MILMENLSLPKLGGGEELFVFNVLLPGNYRATGREIRFSWAKYSPIGRLIELLAKNEICFRRQIKTEGACECRISGTQPILCSITFALLSAHLSSAELI